MKKEELLALLRQHMGTSGSLGDKLVTEIIRQVNTGLPLSRAIDKALSETAFTAGYFNQLIDTICTAALLGYGIKTPTMEMKTAVREYLLSDSWAPDKMKLSKRLHGTSKQMRTAIVDTIAAAMRKGKAVKQMSMDLYDGYNSGKKVLRGSELPQYLQRMVAAARSAASGDITITRDLNQAIKQAQKQLEKMDQPDKALKAAYTQLVKAAEDLNVKAIEKAAWVAVQEKARYYADRIAVTESSRAWSDGFYAKTYDDPLIIGYGWRLSTRHPRVDICDFHAKVDHYGMGAGNYPKEKMPPHPAHPFCTCNLIVIYKGEAESGKFNSDAGAAWLSAQSKEDREKILGIDGNRQFEQDSKWQKRLRNWQGHVDPKPKLQRILKNVYQSIQDVNRQGLKGLITPDNSYIPEEKLIKYALNMEHPKGKEKAIAFEKALGYNLGNWHELIGKINEGLKRHPAKEAGITPVTGKKKYTVKMVLDGVNGKTADVLTVWEENEDGSFRMVNAYVDKRKNI